MFTVKLTTGEQTKFIEVSSVTHYNRGPYSQEIICHFAGGLNEIYYVGEGPPTKDRVFYDRAIIENSEGRTTEVIRTRARPAAGYAYPPPPDTPDNPAQAAERADRSES